MSLDAGSAPRAARPRGLTRETFDALLRQLDVDREKAGTRYEEIRRRLIRLFEWRGCGAPEDLADETLNRVARRIEEGLAFRSGDPYSYCCGVAHLLFKEELRRTAREERALQSGGVPPPVCFPEEEPAQAEGLAGLRWCLQQLSQDERDLVLRYHQGPNNVRNRQALAAELGIRLNALRIRVHRVRRKLEDCLRERLQS